MTTGVKIISFLLFFFGLVAIAPKVHADAHEKAAPKSAKQSARVNPTSKAGETAAQTGPSGQTAYDDDFVDKDGDGIRDGKEHRFRRHSKHRNDAGRHAGKQRRRRAQKGKGNGS
jgi:hypothetical protein